MIWHFVVPHTIFALVTKQVTTFVRYKGTNKLVMLQVVFDIMDKKREEKISIKRWHIR